MNFGRFIRNFDKFGYTIHLNFKRQGEEVKTNIGGFISILLRVFIFSSIILKLFIMFSYQSTVSSLESTMNESQMTDIFNISYSDTNVLLYYRVVGAKYNNL